MLVNVVFLLLLMWGQDSAWSVRLVEVRVPAHEREGGAALLGCQYDLEGDTLYSVKWYKDGQEFFRYVPMNEPKIIAFRRRGTHVNISRSSSTVVVLEHLTRESDGIYSCEVSGEAPNFATASSQKRIKIHLLPESGPFVSGTQREYFLDDMAVVNCTSAASRPPANLTWLVNGQPVTSSDLVGPWYRVATSRPDAVETTLQLRFIVAPKHFVNGLMELTCQATIAPLYQRMTKSEHYIGLPFTMTEKTSQIFDSDYYSSGSGYNLSLMLALCVALFTGIIIF